MQTRFVSAAEHGLDATADVLTLGFSDYFVVVPFTSSALATMARVDDVDFALSRVALVDGAPVAAALVARRGRVSRVAGMAVAPLARRRGIGAALVERLVDDARARGDTSLDLEVIEQNHGAVQLYTALGFRPLRRLLGYEGRPHGSASSDLVVIAPREVADRCAEHGFVDPPWQISAPTLARLEPPFVALRAGPSAVLLSDPSAPAITIRALVTEKPARRRGHAIALLRAIFARHPDKEWRVGALWPEDDGAVFLRAGLTIRELTQAQMRRELP